VAQLVKVFAAVREIMADDGTLWLNLGDSYANDAKWGGSTGGKHVTALHGKTGVGREKKTTGVAPKNLIGIPWRVAFALQADGWCLRSDIIWHKPNPMPESVTDRPTKAHEYLFLLAKSERYYYDSAAIAEAALRPEGAGNKYPYEVEGERPGENANLGGSLHKIGPRETRNRRTVWSVVAKPQREAHFATFPPELIEPCILAGSAAGGTVFDPFMGSGTTARVALSLGRQFIGCELNPAYAGIQDRIGLQAGMAI
jgi:DNA modification methylase